MSTHKSGTFVNKDGYKLFEQSWVPDNPKAVVLIVHGYAEHSSRYTHVAAHLNAAGYAVYTYDHFGHGQSQGRKAYFDTFDILRDDLLQKAKRVKADAGDLPVFAIGHSMGGLVTAYATVTGMPEFDGVVFSSAALAAGDDISPLLIKLSSILSRFLPKLPTTKLDKAAISRDPATIASYDSDPLNYRGGMMARTGAEMLRAINIVQEAMPTITYPLYIFHGTVDKIANVEGSMQLYARVGSADKTLKLHDGYYHECMNEPEKEAVIGEIVAWLDGQVEKIAAGSAEKQSHHKSRAKKKQPEAKSTS